MTPAGFPHSDILGSQFGCQLPEAYRRLLRPSSAPGAKASTVCPYQLDHTASPPEPPPAAARADEEDVQAESLKMLASTVQFSSNGRRAAPALAPTPPHRTPRSRRAVHPAVQRPAPDPLPPTPTRGGMASRPGPKEQAVPVPSGPNSVSTPQTPSTTRVPHPLPAEAGHRVVLARNEELRDAMSTFHP